MEKCTILGASNAATKRLKYNPKKDNARTPRVHQKQCCSENPSIFFGGKGIKGHVDNFAVDVELPFHDKISMTRIPNEETFTRFPLWPDLMSSNGKGKELLIILPFGDEIDKSFVSKSRKRSKNEWIPY